MPLPALLDVWPAHDVLFGQFASKASRSQQKHQRVLQLSTAAKQQGARNLALTKQFADFVTESYAKLAALERERDGLTLELARLRL